MTVADFWSGVEAIGTLVAAAAVIGLWRLDRSHGARAHARRVIAALSTGRDLDDDDRAALALDGVNANAVYLVVRNLADAPIYDVRIEALEGEAEPLTPWKVILPGDRKVVATGLNLVPGLATSDAVRVAFSLDDIDWHLERSELTRVERDRWWHL